MAAPSDPFLSLIKLTEESWDQLRAMQHRTGSVKESISSSRRAISQARDAIKQADELLIVSNELQLSYRVRQR